jgi:hypothetical protein
VADHQHAVAAGGEPPVATGLMNPTSEATLNTAAVAIAIAVHAADERRKGTLTEHMIWAATMPER